MDSLFKKIYRQAVLFEQSSNENSIYYLIEIDPYMQRRKRSICGAYRLPDGLRIGDYWNAAPDTVNVKIGRALSSDGTEYRIISAAEMRDLAPKFAAKVLDNVGGACDYYGPMAVSSVVFKWLSNMPRETAYI